MIVLDRQWILDVPQHFLEAFRAENSEIFCPNLSIWGKKLGNWPQMDLQSKSSELSAWNFKNFLW